MKGVEQNESFNHCIKNYFNTNIFISENLLLGMGL